MREDLKKMKIELAAMVRSNRLLRSAVQEVSRANMIRASLIFRSDNHENIPVEKILDGEFPKEVPVQDYVFIGNCSNLVQMGMSSLEMGNSLDKHLLVTGYRILSENENGYFRKSSPVVYAFNHVPPHAVDAESMLEETLRRAYSRQAGDDVILKAMYIHNKIIDIWPFEEYNAELAAFALNYYLMENGLAPISFALRREDYLGMVTDCLKGIHQEEFYNFLSEAVTEKMKGTIDACRGFINNQS